MKIITKKIANSAALGATIMPYAFGAIALAQDSDEIVKEQSDLEASIEQVPSTDRVGGPISVLSRAYSDNSDVEGKNQHYQVIVSNGLCKLAFRDEGDSRIVGADLNFGKIDECLGSLSNGTLNGFRFNIGTEEIRSTGDRNSRVLVERSYGDSNWFDFWNFELQDNAKPLDNRVAGAAGLKFNVSNDSKMNLKPQFTIDSEGNFGYAVILNTGENSGIGAGGKRINGLDTFNASVHYKWTDADSFLNGYKIWVRGKAYENAPVNGNSDSGLEARIQFGDQTPGGAFVNGVQDTLFNSITPFLAGDGDATFPFGIGNGDGRLDFFGAAASNSGKAGKFSFDVKYSDPGITDRYLKTDIALGLGDISSTFLKHNKFQIGRTSYLDSRSLANDLSNFEYHTTIAESHDNSWALHFGVRAAKPENARTSYSAAVAVTLQF